MNIFGGAMLSGKYEMSTARWSTLPARMGLNISISSGYTLSKPAGYPAANCFIDVDKTSGKYAIEIISLNAMAYDKTYLLGLGQSIDLVTTFGGYNSGGRHANGTSFINNIVTGAFWKDCSAVNSRDLILLDFDNRVIGSVNPAGNSIVYSAAITGGSPLYLGVTITSGNGAVSLRLNAGQEAFLPANEALIPGNYTKGLFP